MDNALLIGLSRQTAMMREMSVVANNLANMNTAGYTERNAQQRVVTGKTLDGLYYMIGEEEKKIRQDPVGTGSEILKAIPNMITDFALEFMTEKWMFLISSMAIFLFVGLFLEGIAAMLVLVSAVFAGRRSPS